MRLLRRGLLQSLTAITKLHFDFPNWCSGEANTIQLGKSDEKTRGCAASNMTPKFTFVNTTDAPALSSSDAKLMRAHVTKTNFAQRRKRIAIEGWQNAQQRKTSRKELVDTGFREIFELTPRERSSQRPSSEEGQLSLARFHGTRTRRTAARHTAETCRKSQPVPALLTTMNLVMADPADPDLSIRYLFHEFAPLIFPTGMTSAGTPGETNWAGLLVEEPALLEATMAIGVRCRPSFIQDGRVTCAEVHTAKAISLVNQRIASCTVAVSDGVLATVFTLAFAELVSRNETAWGIHIDGLTKMVKLRQAHNKDSIPSWFVDVLLYDGFSINTPSQRRRYQQLLDALVGENYHDRKYVNVSAVVDDVEALRQALNFHHSYGMSSEFVAGEIEEPVSRLHDVAQRLAADRLPFLRALGNAVKVFLELSWPRIPKDELSDLALVLQKSLENNQLKICSTIDMTVWQYFIGALASELGSVHRQWYTSNLRKTLASGAFRTWRQVDALWEKSLRPDDRLLEQFKGLWEECKTEDGILEAIFPENGDFSTRIAT